MIKAFTLIVCWFIIVVPGFWYFKDCDDKFFYFVPIAWAGLITALIVGAFLEKE